MNDYSKKHLAEELTQQIDDGSDCRQIARWAYRTYLLGQTELGADLKELLMQLATMEQGPEFEMNRDELEGIVDLLRE